jgi:hypothetical protein
MTALPHPLDHEGRALWHLEILGCHVPEDAVAPYEPSPFVDQEEYDDDYDDEFSCTRCGGEGFRDVDDIWWDDCDEFGMGPCTSCCGTGLRSHQWVF